MDQIFISGLKLEATIGIHPEERLAPQSIVLDIELTTDTRKVAVSDNIIDTIDYDVLIKELHTWVAEKTFQLVETLADELVTKILNTFLKVQNVKLRLHKFPTGLPVTSVGVVVMRSRK